MPYRPNYTAVDACFLLQPAARRLVRLLSPADPCRARGLLLSLQCYVANCCPTGDLGAISARSLADVCEWMGDPEVMLDGLLIAGVLVMRGRRLVWPKWADATGPGFPLTAAFERRRAVALRKQVMARDGNTCRYCGCATQRPHVDHVQPISRGGKSTLDNLVVACAPCNLSKGSREVI